MNMRGREQLVSAAIVFAGAMALLVSNLGYTQALWKYTDKDGKVTYSDKAPKKDENAQLVISDPAANIVDAPKNSRQGESQKSGERKTRLDERESKSNELRDVLEKAKAELELAKTALEDGRALQPDEVQIVVGRAQTGAPTGANAQIRKPGYYARIAALEEAVKKAENMVEAAEQNYRRGAP
jgi:hypothetical protein